MSNSYTKKEEYVGYNSSNAFSFGNNVPMSNSPNKNSYDFDYNNYTSNYNYDSDKNVSGNDNAYHNSNNY